MLCISAYVNYHFPVGMGLLPDTKKNWGLQMRRERFPRHRELATPTCITARVWRTCRVACQDRWLAVSFDVVVSRWGKCSRHSPRMHNPQFFVHAVYSPAGKVLWVFVSGKLLTGFKTPLKLSEVNLNCDDIFIMFKDSTQQGADGSISWAFL